MRKKLEKWRTILFNLENFHILKIAKHSKICYDWGIRSSISYVMNFCSLCFLCNEVLCETCGWIAPSSLCVYIEWHLSSNVTDKNFSDYGIRNPPRPKYLTKSTGGYKCHSLYIYKIVLMHKHLIFS